MLGVVGLGAEFVFAVGFFFFNFDFCFLWSSNQSDLWDSVGLRWSRCFFRICGLGYSDEEKDCLLGDTLCRH